MFDVLRDGETQFIIGRDDGRVEIFAPERHGRGQPQKIFSRDLGESIKSVDAGYVSSTEFPEVVVGTFSGKVVSFTTEPIQARAVEDTYGRSVQTLNDENRIKQLRKDIAEIQAQIDKDSAKLKSATKGGTAAVPLVKDFPVSCKFALDHEIGAFQLSAEIQTSIDLVLVTSPVPLTLVDTEASGTTIVSLSSVADTPTSDNKLNKYVATFRCQASDSRRMSAAIRTNEGEFGDIVVSIVIAGSPKAAKVIKFPLKPLSIHTRVHEFSAEEVSRPRHSLQYRVVARISFIHEWLTTIFPEIPPHIDENSVKECLNFRNVFTGGICQVVYMKDSLVVESDSASVIAIVKEHIGRIGTTRRIQLNETVSMSDQACVSFLGLVLPKLGYQVQLARRFHLIDTIAEITAQEDDIR
jgi:Bardet-Biedl syndrome 7 protein